MSSVDMLRKFIEYHLDMTRRVWNSIDKITDEQFLSELGQQIKRYAAHLFQ